MNLVFLSSEAIHQFYLINEVHKHHPVKKVFFQTAHMRRSSFGEKLVKLTKPRLVRLFVRSILASVLFRKEAELQRQYETKVFFNNATPSLDPSIPFEMVTSFNTPEGVEKVRQEAPDLIVVFGTDILKGEILRVAKLNILNIHRDILPKYRGGGLPFWVFYNNDFDNLGTTVHVCAEKLDAGDIIGQRYYKLQRDDEIYKLRHKTTLLAVEILKEVIDKYKNGTVEFREQEKTKLWTSRDMTIVKELIARRNFRRYINSLMKRCGGLQESVAP